MVCAGLEPEVLVNEILEKVLNGGDEFEAREIGPNGKRSPLSEENDGDGGGTGK